MNLRAWFLIGLFVVCVVALGLAFRHASEDANILRPHDYMEYWSAGQALWQGQNPYDGGVLDPIQRRIQQRLPASEIRPDPIMMWNPPWTLPLTLLLAALPWRVGQLFWLVLNLTAVLGSCAWLWRMYRGDSRLSQWPLVVGLTFAPTVFLLLLGQISGLLLLGITGYLWGVRANRFGIAGCFAALTAIKPHLFALFAVVLLLEAARGQRAWRSVLCGGLVLAACSVIPLSLNPDVWTQYRLAGIGDATGPEHSVQDWMNPTLGYLIRMQLPGQPFRTMFIPLLVSLPILLGYWWSRRQTWTWTGELPRLILASVLVAPYGAWGFDLVLLLVPVVQAATWLTATRSRPILLGSALLLLCLNVAALLTLQFGNSMCNGWFAPLTALGYLGAGWATSTNGMPHAHPQEATA